MTGVQTCALPICGIDASQADYFQSVKGGGHGGYHLLVLAPDSVQEMYDHAILGLDLSDRYRMPTMILADAVIGQMKESMIPHPYQAPELPEKDWAVTGKQGRSEQKIVKSLFLGDGELEAHNWKLHRKYELIKQREVRFEADGLEDAELIVTAFGTAARIAKTAIAMAREAGLKVGLLRPITLYPFPEKAFLEATQGCKRVLTIELNNGQMVQDVKLSVARDAEVAFYGRPAGAGSLPTPEELFEQIRKQIRGVA